MIYTATSLLALPGGELDLLFARLFLGLQIDGPFHDVPGMVTEILPDGQPALTVVPSFTESFAAIDGIYARLEQLGMHYILSADTDGVRCRFFRDEALLADVRLPKPARPMLALVIAAILAIQKLEE